MGVQGQPAATYQDPKLRTNKKELKLRHEWKIHIFIIYYTNIDYAVSKYK
jgi:hypothetical protein